MFCCKLPSSSIGTQLEERDSHFSSVTQTSSCKDVLPEGFTVLPNASLTELNSDYPQNAKWPAFSPKVTCYQRRQKHACWHLWTSQTRKWFHYPHRQKTTFLTFSSGIVFGLLECTRIHCRLPADNMETCANILNTYSPKSLYFFLCKHTRNLLLV